MVRPLPRAWLLRGLFPVFIDFLILFLSLSASFLTREPELLRPGVYASFMPLFVMWCGVFYAAGLYEMRLVRDFVALISGLLASSAVCWGIGASYFYFTTPYLDLTPKTHLLVTIAAAHLAMLAQRRAILSLTDYSLLRLRIFLLADPELSMRLGPALSTHSTEHIDLTEDINSKIDIVVADSAWIESHWLEARRVFSSAISSRIPIVSLDAFYESLYGRISPAAASDPRWALEFVLPRTDSFYFKIKRFTDIAGACILLILLSPILLLVAAAIIFADGGAPIYAQRRVGHMGRIFVLWKFRSMRPGSDSKGPFAPKVEAGGGDGITPLGSILRRFRVDELPQLWNVLRGDMSLVGPRPEWVSEVEILEKSVPHYHLRHLVPPGITGWAQVYFRATDNPEDSIEKHHYDLYYLKHFSFALDLTILLKTLKRILVKDSRVPATPPPFPTALPAPRATAVDIASIINRN